MLLYPTKLFVAGPPDVIDEEEVYKTIGHPDTQAKLVEQDGSLQGKLGSKLLALSATDGSELAHYDLKSLPQ